MHEAFLGIEGIHTTEILNLNLRFVFFGEIFILLSICSIVVPLIVPGQVIHGFFFQIDGSRTLAVLETSNTSF